MLMRVLPLKLTHLSCQSFLAVLQESIRTMRRLDRLCFGLPLGEHAGWRKNNLDQRAGIAGGANGH